MTDEKAFGIVGLGRMAGGVAREARSRFMRVVATARSGLPAELSALGVIDADGRAGFRKHLQPPRVIRVWVQAGSSGPEL